MADLENDSDMFLRVTMLQAYLEMAWAAVLMHASHDVRRETIDAARAASRDVAERLMAHFRDSNGMEIAARWQALDSEFWNNVRSGLQSAPGPSVD